MPKSFRLPWIVPVWVIVCLSVSGLASGQPIIYVDDDATGANDGSSWCDAFVHLQDALEAVQPPAEIRVAQGVYKPDQGTGQVAGDREATFQLINRVALSGGYAGCGAPTPDERDIVVYQTVFSGDLNGNDGSNFVNNDENSYHVVNGSDTDSTAILDGCIIRAGNANGSYSQRAGGGFYSDDGSPTVIACTFRA